MSLASAVLSGWLGHSAQPNQVMTIMLLVIAALATIFALVGLLIKSSSSAKIMLGFSGTLLAVGAAAGLLIGAFATSNLTVLLVGEWVIVAILMALLSRSVGLVLIGATLVPVGWLFWQGESISTLDLVTYLTIAIIPLIIGLLLPRNNPLALPAASTTQPSQQKTNRSVEQGSTRAIINAMSEGVITLNDQGVITLINPAAEKISGWSKQDALKLSHKTVLNLVDKTFKQVSDGDNPIIQAINSNAPVDSRKLLLETKSEKRINLSLIVTPIDSPNGGVIVVFRDITNELAEESAQAEFISTASHEMRTPVASIEGYLGLALNPNTAQIDDKAREFITKAHESAGHLGELFQDLLDITKADDGLLQNNPEPIDLADFAGDVVDGLSHKAKEKSLSLEFAPKNHAIDSGTKAVKSGRRVDPTYYVRVDKGHLREVIANLTENAIKYTLEGAIKVDITGDNQHVVLSFADTGVGIPSEDQEHLFQKFYRVDNSDTREIGGTGLGLYLVRRLVDTMGGRIWVESEYGKGSTFFVQLDRLDSVTAKQQLSALAINKAQNSPANQSTSTTVSPPTTNPTDPAPQAAVAPTNPAPTPQPVAAPVPASPAQPAPQTTVAPAQAVGDPAAPTAQSPASNLIQPAAAPAQQPPVARPATIPPQLNTTNTAQVQPDTNPATQPASVPASVSPVQATQPVAPVQAAPVPPQPEVTKPAQPAARRSGAVNFTPSQASPSAGRSPSQTTTPDSNPPSNTAGQSG